MSEKERIGITIPFFFLFAIPFCGIATATIISLLTAEGWDANNDLYNYILLNNNIVAHGKVAPLIYTLVIAFTGLAILIGCVLVRFIRNCQNGASKELTVFHADAVMFWTGLALIQGSSSYAVAMYTGTNDAIQLTVLLLSPFATIPLVHRLIPYAFGGKTNPNPFAFAILFVFALVSRAAISLIPYANYAYHKIRQGDSNDSVDAALYICSLGFAGVDVLCMLILFIWNAGHCCHGNDATIVNDNNNVDLKMNADSSDASSAPALSEQNREQRNSNLWVFGFGIVVSVAIIVLGSINAGTDGRVSIEVFHAMGSAVNSTFNANQPGPQYLDTSRWPIHVHLFAAVVFYLAGLLFYSWERLFKNTIKQMNKGHHSTLGMACFCLAHGLTAVAVLMFSGVTNFVTIVVLMLLLVSGQVNASVFRAGSIFKASPEFMASTSMHFVSVVIATAVAYGIIYKDEVYKSFKYENASLILSVSTSALFFISSLLWSLFVHSSSRDKQGLAMIPTRLRMMRWAVLSSLVLHATAVSIGSFAVFAEW